MLCLRIVNCTVFVNGEFALPISGLPLLLLRSATGAVLLDSVGKTPSTHSLLQDCPTGIRVSSLPETPGLAMERRAPRAGEPRDKILHREESR